MAHFYLSAAHKSSGKTTLSIGLAAAFAARGLRLAPFKKGPDYIDPLWLQAASGQPCHHLDLYLESPQAVLQHFQRYMMGADLGLIEGNKGLFDGMALDGSDSNAAVAKLVKAPVVLVLDVRGMTRGIAPLLQGYVGFDQDVDIRGVILNHVGGSRHEGKLRESVATYTDLKVLGAVPHRAEASIDERHLGLMPSNEHAASQHQIALIRDLVSQHVDLDALLALAQQAPDVPPASTLARPTQLSTKPRVRIGIARDAAFGFYYAEDLDAFEAAGAELVFFDTLHDAALPAALDGLFIGGGFPESHMQELEQNGALRQQIHAFIEADKPVYAECGGLMYLCRSLSWHGKSCRMVGSIGADVVMQERPQGRGYVQVQERAQHPWLAQQKPTLVKAHEFHYSRLDNLPDNLRFAYDVQRGHGVDGQHDGLIYRNLLANYTHLRDSEGNHWVAKFIDFVARCKQRGH